MKYHYYQNKKGSTLIEYVLAASLVVIITGAASLILRDSFYHGRFMQAIMLSEQEGRGAVSDIVKELRAASVSNSGEYPIASVSKNSVIFFGDINGDGLRERVRYFLDGTTLKKGIVVPSGTPYTYNTSTEKVISRAGNVANSNDGIFSYYGQDYEGSGSSLSEPINVSLIRFVRIRLVIDRDPTNPPAPLEISSQVSIRNLKENL